MQAAVRLSRARRPVGGLTQPRRRWIPGARSVFPARGRRLCPETPLGDRARARLATRYLGRN